MKEFDSFGLSICKSQAELFEKSIQKASLSSPDFVRRFMNSKIAGRIDLQSYINEDLTAEKILEQINSEYKTRKTQKKYTSEQMYWMGYLYRFWSYTYELPSRLVYSYIPATELVKLYEPYHTLDCKAVVERIIEAKHIEKRKLLNEKMAEIYGHI